jgi:hypothetical protein
MVNIGTSIGNAIGLGITAGIGLSLMKAVPKLMNPKHKKKYNDFSQVRY